MPVPVQGHTDLFLLYGLFWLRFSIHVHLPCGINGGRREVPPILSYGHCAPLRLISESVPSVPRFPKQNRKWVGRAEPSQPLKIAAGSACRTRKPWGFNLSVSGYLLAATDSRAHRDPNSIRIQEVLALQC